MTIKANVRKFALTAHIVSSVGWLGAVAAFLALAVAGLTNRDAQMARSAYLAMELITWFVIVPSAFASLLTGLVVSLGSEWGLVRHYWVLAKLLITIIATVLLLIHTQPVGLLAALARETASPGAGSGRLQIQLVVDAVVALLALFVNVMLSVFKPWGMTPYGLRVRWERRSVSRADVPSRLESDVGLGSAAETPRWVYVVGIHAIGLALLFLVAHLIGGVAWGH
jgi:hypothetical protein